MCWQYSQKIFRKTGFTLFKLFPVTIYESSSFPIYSTNLNRLKWFIKLDPTLAFTQTRRKCIVSCKSSFEISPSRWLILVTLSISWLYLVTASLGDHVPDWLVPYHKLRTYAANAMCVMQATPTTRRRPYHVTCMLLNARTSWSCIQILFRTKVSNMKRWCLNSKHLWPSKLLW